MRYGGIALLSISWSTAKLWSCSSSIDYETHRALSNIMDCEEYDLPDVSKG
ncbi:MAG: hypothetical protein Q4F50_01740 [Bacteroides sp.]|uniref:hypothetical protein n=1 Tax=Bacteroides sp. TaxID=29523 RepID=UPI0026E079C0|nr:hypothetical protein [Bacteroides sp.]MDO5418776.1 hypothetical protein [Bacteroides sp.]